MRSFSFPVSFFLILLFSYSNSMCSIIHNDRVIHSLITSNPTQPIIIDFDIIIMKICFPLIILLLLSMILITMMLMISDDKQLLMWDSVSVSTHHFHEKMNFHLSRFRSKKQQFKNDLTLEKCKKIDRMNWQPFILIWFGFSPNQWLDLVIE